MRKRKASIILIAIAVMAIAATSAFAYYETWSGWMSSGTFYYNNNPYTYSSDGGNFSDSTYSVSRDTFFIAANTQASIPFVCSAINDTIYLTPSTSIDSTTGGKNTGQVTDRSADGIWAAYGYIVSASTNFTIWGTWDGDFVYGGGTPTYTAEGESVNSSGADVTGEFDSDGSRISFIP